MLKFTKEVFNHFLNSNTFQKGASLAYYAVFSLLPVIIIITSVLGLFYGKQAVSGEIYTKLKDFLGKRNSQMGITKLLLIIWMLSIMELFTSEHPHKNFK